MSFGMRTWTADGKLQVDTTTSILRVVSSGVYTRVGLFLGGGETIIIPAINPTSNFAFITDPVIEAAWSINIVGSGLILLTYLNQVPGTYDIPVIVLEF